MPDPVQIWSEPTFLEGPVWCPAPDASAQDPSGGTLVVTDVAEGALHRVDLERGTTTKIADTLGGANGATPCADGGFLVTQNGGLDFEAIGDVRGPAAGRVACVRASSASRPTGRSRTSRLSRCKRPTTSWSRPTARSTSPIPRRIRSRAMPSAG